MDRRRTLNGGFTLLELAVVLVIAALLFAAAVPRSGDRDQIGSAARALASDAARARSYATRTWSTITLEVDAANAAWRAVRLDGTWLELPGAGDFGWRGCEPGISLEAVEGYATNPAFLPNGRVAAEARVRIRSGAESWVMRVEPLSGRIAAAPEL